MKKGAHESAICQVGGRRDREKVQGRSVSRIMCQYQ